MSSPTERVAVAAQNVKLLRILLSILAFPFYLLGWFAGLVVVAVMWFVAAAQVGFSDVRKPRPDDEPT